MFTFTGLSPRVVRIQVFLHIVLFTFIVAPKESVNCEDTIILPIFTIQIRNYWEGLSGTLWQLLFPIPQRDLTIESYGYTRNTLTTAKTLGENGELVGAVGFCLSAKAQIQKIGSGKIRRRHKFGTPRFLAASFDFTWAVTKCDETWNLKKNSPIY